MSREKFMALGVAFGTLSVSSWSDPEGTADLTDQADFRLADVIGLRTTVSDDSRYKERLTVYLRGESAVFCGSPNPAYYDQFSDALIALRTLEDA